MNIMIIIIITTNLYHNVQVFVLNKSMLFYVINILFKATSPTYSSFQYFKNILN